MKVIVCDDYPLIVKHLIRTINQVAPNAECIGFSDPRDVLSYIETGTSDVAVLDIEMPYIDGLTLAKRILEKNPKTNIIFVTGHPQYSLEAHQLYSSSFIVKPVTADAMKQAFEHLRNPVSDLNESDIKKFYSGKIGLGSNIRRLRIRKGMTVPQLAELLNVSAQTVYRWENNERMPDIVKFLMISDIFGIDAKELLK